MLARKNTVPMLADSSESCDDSQSTRAITAHTPTRLTRLRPPVALVRKISAQRHENPKVEKPKAQPTRAPSVVLAIEGSLRAPD